MPFTVLYAENIFGDDSVERRIYGPDVRVILAEPNRSLADIPDADCAAADGLLLVTYRIDAATAPASRNCARSAARAVGYDTIDRKHRAGEPWAEGRLIITPHAAFFSPQAWEDTRVKAAETMRAALFGPKPQNVIPPDGW